MSPLLRRYFRPAAAGLTIAAALLAANIHPVTTPRSGVADAGNVTQKIIGGTVANSNEFRNVGALKERGYAFCTGTLIAPNWVLTAGHCVEGIRASRLRRFTFDVAGASYGWSSVKLHPTYNFPDGDVALIKLSRSVPATGTTGATPATLRTAAPQEGQTMTIVGFGLTGTGATGNIGTTGTKRFGSVILDDVTPTFVYWFFESPELHNTAPGDSGGPGFIEGSIASVCSGGSNANAAWGDESFNTRTDVYRSWINTSMLNANSLDRVPRGVRALVDPVAAAEMAVDALPDTEFIETTIRPLVLDRDIKKSR